MELLLSAVSAGGLVGAANQYMCLLVISVAARLGWIGLTPEVGFMDAWWFIAIVAVFWILTVLPAYSTLFGPGVMNAVNTTVNILSGFVVPASATLLTLASIGVISAEHPELLDLLRTLRIFDPSGERVGPAGWLLAGGSAVTAATLTGAKFLAKPAISAVTGTTGTAAAPIYATAENVGSLLLMGLAYILMKIDPWLLVGLTAFVVLATLAVLVWAIYQLWRLGRGIGQVIGLIEEHPKAGLAVVAEFLMWGLGWLIWERWSRGAIRLFLWLVWLGVAVFGIPALGAALAAALVAVPFLEFVPVLFLVGAETMIAMLGLFIGLRTARSLLHTFDGRGAQKVRTGPETSATAA
jgi:hypothetical protein